MTPLLRLIALAAILFSQPLLAANPATDVSPDGVWTLQSGAEHASRAPAGAEPWVQPLRYQPALLDSELLATTLLQAPMEWDSPARFAGSTLTLPLPNGGFERFAVVESPVMEFGLASWMAAQGWPMKTYKGVSLDRPGTTARLDWGGPGGFHAMISRAGEIYFIDPAWRGNAQIYRSYYKRDYPRGDKTFSCGVSGVASDPDAPIGAARAATGTGGDLRTYRTAVAATGEYTAFHGGTAAAGQAAIVTTINRVNEVYERDFSLRLVLIDNNSSVVYTNGATDPYTNNDGFAMLSENQTNLDNVIGTSNYDLGHVVSTGGGGIASLRASCNSLYKAQGVTGSSSPVGDPFDIDYVAHEIGHQLGGNHTFNSVTLNCGGGNRNETTAYEPGSGSTIQAYAGICGSDDLQPNSDSYYHGVSLDEMLNHLGGLGDCWAVDSTPNPNEPTVSAGADYTIPIGTPFELTALNGTDLDGDTLSYTWEEFDLGPPTTVTDPDNGSSPLFRSWPPSTSPSRTIPPVEHLSSGTLPVGEQLPATDRTMNFRVTVRDNNPGGGRVSDDTMTVTSTTSAGPFLVTYPNGGEMIDTDSQPAITVTWDVAGTSVAPVSAANVAILLSEDGGLSYPHTLLASTPNDGSQSVTLPTGVSTAGARVRVQGVGNIFFDISDGDFALNGIESCDTTATPIAYQNPATRTLFLTETAIIKDLDLGLDITHPWVGDLKVTLEHVDTGTSVLLIDRPGLPNIDTNYGCGQENIAAVLDDASTLPVEDQCSSTPPAAINGRFAPNNPLSAFNGESFDGTWRLQVEDVIPADDGTLTNWCLLGSTSLTTTQCETGPLTLLSPGYSSGIYELSSETAIITDPNGSVAIGAGVVLTLEAPTITFGAGFSAATGSQISARVTSVTCP